MRPSPEQALKVAAEFQPAAERLDAAVLLDNVARAYMLEQGRASTTSVTRESRPWRTGTTPPRTTRHVPQAPAAARSFGIRLAEARFPPARASTASGTNATSTVQAAALTAHCAKPGRAIALAGRRRQEKGPEGRRRRVLGKRASDDAPPAPGHRRQLATRGNAPWARPTPSGEASVFDTTLTTVTPSRAQCGRGGRGWPTLLDRLQKPIEANNVRLCVGT